MKGKELTYKNLGMKIQLMYNMTHFFIPVISEATRILTMVKVKLSLCFD
jgi:hypothetical protein